MKTLFLCIGSLLCFSTFAAAGFDDFGDRNYGVGPESDLRVQCQATIKRLFPSCAGSNGSMCNYVLPQTCAKMVKVKAASCASGCNLRLLCEVGCLQEATRDFEKEATRDTFTPHY